jgi:ribokinase
MKRILVLGSLNIDLVQRVPRIPAAGETLKGGDLQIFVGGKGANQACAAALLGGRVQMGGKVGNDVFADRLLRELEAAGVDTTLVSGSNLPSGSATIFVLPNGDNMIVISPGANGDVSVDFALQAIDTLQSGDSLLCQLEIPLESVAAALESAYKKAVITILDPAPAYPLPDDLLTSVSILTPNQTEAAILADTSEPPNTMMEAESVARRLQARGARTVIVKMGDHGCLVADGTSTTPISGFRVAVRDTTAAGDTFNGALAAALSLGGTLAEAANFANAAAALSVTKPGAIASIPSRSEVAHFLALQAANR